jgi:Transposase DDE domain
MRHEHCTVTPAFVRALAQQALAKALPWKGYGRLATAQKILDALVLAACLVSSLSAVVKRFRFGFSHETARKAVDSNLPADLQTLTQGLLDALYLFGSRALRRRKWVIAIDEHRDPFYGDRSTFAVTGGQKKHGTKYAFGYATAVLAHLRHRFTVGLVALTGGEKPHEVVAALLAQIDERGLKLRGVVLDSAFDSGETILLLQGRGLSYTVPLRRKGDGDNPRNAIWQLEVGTVARVKWKTKKTRRAVSTQVVVMRRPKEKDKKVYAFGGWDEKQARRQGRRAALARRWYRKRFGIETSYRQMRQAKVKTTKKDVRYRLLLIGLALILRQAWVWLTRHLARDGGLKPSQWVAILPLGRMAAWLAGVLEAVYKEEKVIRLKSPLPQLTGFSV